MEINKNKENGRIAENLFAKYLNDNKIPFYRIDQEKETYSTVFSDNEIRRPDFIINLKKGMFHIDVKYRKKKSFGENKEKRFYLNMFEIRGLTNFQNDLNSDIWIAFTEDLENPDFHYISLSSVNEYFEYLYNTIGDEFYTSLNKDKVESNKYYEWFFYFFPENLFYHNLSIENGFFMKNIDQNYFNNEAEYHKNIWRKS
jgi:hypothetical protein